MMDVLSDESVSREPALDREVEKELDLLLAGQETQSDDESPLRFDALPADDAGNDSREEDLTLDDVISSGMTVEQVLEKTHSRQEEEIETVSEETADTGVELQIPDMSSADAALMVEDESSHSREEVQEAVMKAETASAPDSVPSSEEAQTGVDFPELEDGEPSDESSIITAGMTIYGNITSKGSLDVLGRLVGNLNIRGKLNISGDIHGNSKASEIFADSARITGEVISSGPVKIGQDSVIIGNITASSAVIAGAVKGNIDVTGPVILDTSAIVMGDIKSKSVQINNGAVIEGHCSQSYADVSPTAFFEDLMNTMPKN